MDVVDYVKKVVRRISANDSGLCVVALSRNLKLTTTLDRAITQNPCYVPLNFQNDVKIKNSSRANKNKQQFSNGWV